jgi:hypothetical protein
MIIQSLWVGGITLMYYAAQEIKRNTRLDINKPDAHIHMAPHPLCLFSHLEEWREFLFVSLHPLSQRIAPHESICLYWTL